MDAYNYTYAYAYNSTYNYTDVDALLSFKKDLIDRARTTKGFEKIQIMLFIHYFKSYRVSTFILFMRK